MADVSLTINGVTFTFLSGEIDTISSTLNPDIENNALSKSGPAAAYNYDYNGVTKEIRVSGALIESSTSRVPGYSINTIIEQKQWLESLVNGNQNNIQFTSNYESYSIIDSSSPTPPYQAGFANTYCVIKSLQFTEEQGQVNKLNFTMTLVVGQST